ncbi:hypothetical protein [Azospirillum sp. B21]|uniref:PglD-related sugar-binding protein n=1 Tax=Azospirillum sp. B21 TaxID=2607496 RepID=UPI00165F594C|nr:hypothetical protein [Azospirillum sp. B21]
MMRVLNDVAHLPTTVPLFVFGAGQGGRLVVQAIQRRPQMRIEAVIDTYKRGEVDGIPVITPAEFFKRAEPDTPVVIASMYMDEIKLQLVAHGIRNLYNLYPFVRNQLAEARYRRDRLRAASVLAVAVAAAWFLAG